MSDGHKLILTPFIGHKNKNYNMTKEKYIPVKRRQNSVETDTVKVHFTMVMKMIMVIMMMRIIIKIMNSSSYLRVLSIIAENSFTNSPTRTD